MNTPPTAGRRRRLRYLVLALALLAGAAGAAALLALDHLRRHPEVVVVLVERILSQQTGTRVSIGELRYAFEPLQLSLKDVSAESGDDANGLALALPALEVRMDLRGPLGGRVLTVTHLTAAGFSARLWGHGGVTRAPAAPAPTLFRRLALRLVRYFLVSEIRFENLAISDGHLEYRSAGQTGRLENLNLASATPGRLTLGGEIAWHWPGAGSALSGGILALDIQTHGFSADRPLEARLRLERAAFEHPDFRAGELALELQLTYDPADGRIAVPDARLQTRLSTAPGSALPLSEPLPVSLAAAGGVETATGQIEVARWQLAADGLAEANGSAAYTAGDPPTLLLTVTGAGINLKSLLAAVATAAGRGPRPLAAAGRLALAGRIQATFAGEKPQWRSDLTARLNDAPFSYRTDGLSLDGRLSGSIRAAGDLPAPRLEADLRSSRTRLTAGSVHLPDFGASVAITGSHPAYTFALAGTLPAVTAGAGTEGFSLQDLIVQTGEGRFHADTGLWAFDRGSVSAPALGDLALAAGRSRDGLRLALSGEGSRLLQTLAGRAGLPADWQVGLRESFRLSALMPDAGSATVFGIYELSGGGFSSPDGGRLAENIAGRLTLEARLGTGDGALEADLALSAGSGEILWDRFYVNLNANPLAVSGSAAYHRQAPRLVLDGWRLELADLAAVLVQGRMSLADGRGDMDLALRIPDTDAAVLFRQLVVEPYRYERPFLETLQVDGRVGADLALRRSSGGWRVKGRCTWNDGRFADADGSVAARGLFLDLPVWYESGPRRPSEPPLRGHLAAAAFKLPSLVEQPLEMTFKVTPHTVSVTGPTTLESGSGPLRLGPIVLRDAFSSSPTLTTDLEIGPLDMDALIGDLWPRPTGGRLSGRLQTVRFADNRLSGRGQMVLDVFGGRIRISDPALNALTGGSPLLSFDAQVQDLNLGELTEQTAFGKIEGILQGRIDHVEIAHGQLQRFDLALETVRREGVPRKINVRAVENIAQLGGGHSPFIGMAGRVVAWFDEFSYDRIGVRAKLENDVFRVNGTIKEGGREYLVKKSGIPGVDVVNLNPDNRISFKDMLKRIGRIKGGPAQPVIR